uniref:Uncharacterized protein n=1 Tax=Glossina pallidipes TaxID=7398 RepID=A0A1B0A5B6_GLOPL
MTFAYKNGLTTTFDENSILNSKNTNHSNRKGLPMKIVLLLSISKSIPQRSYKFGDDDLGPGHLDCMTQLYISKKNSYLLEQH